MLKLNIFFTRIRVDGASNHSGEQFKKDLVSLSGLTKSVVLIACTGKKWEKK